jgi:hypothetical protein
LPGSEVHDTAYTGHLLTSIVSSLGWTSAGMACSLASAA